MPKSLQIGLLAFALMVLVPVGVHAIWTNSVNACDFGLVGLTTILLYFTRPKTNQESA